MAGIHTGAAEVDHFLDPGIPRGKQDIGANLQVVDIETDRIGHIGLDAANLARGVYDDVRPLVMKIAPDSIFICEIQFGTRRRQNIGHVGRGVRQHIATDHSATACKHDPHDVGDPRPGNQKCMRFNLASASASRMSARTISSTSSSKLVFGSQPTSLALSMHRR